MAKKDKDAPASPNTAQSADYKLTVFRGVEAIIAFDFLILDKDSNQYVYSLRDFDENPKVLKDILGAIATTWPAKDKIRFRYIAPLTGNVRTITEIL
jgi:hypothetical protein